MAIKHIGSHPLIINKGKGVKNAELFEQPKKSQPVRDAFISLVESNGHVLLSEYTHIHDKVLIDFNCGHKPHSLVANSYKHGVRCPHCQNQGRKNHS